jgi:hypothetical protein
MEIVTLPPPGEIAEAMKEGGMWSPIGVVVAEEALTERE